MKDQYDKGKVSKIVLGIFLVCAVSYLTVLYGLNQRVKIVDVSDCEIADETTMQYKIEKIEYKRNYIKISGYAYRQGISVDTADTVLLAHDPTTDIYYELPTENVKKTKLSKNADDGFNYDYAEFQSVVRSKKIPGGCKACIWYRGNGENVLIPTEEVLYY